MEDRQDIEEVNTLDANQKTEVGSVTIFGVTLISLVTEDNEWLCLRQVSNELLGNFSHQQITYRRAALGISCVLSTADQLVVLRRAAVVPLSYRRCGLITLSEAKRLCDSFLEDDLLGSGNTQVFPVYHDREWGCRGEFYTQEYQHAAARCIKCIQCSIFFSPNKFVFHSHSPKDEECNKSGERYTRPNSVNFNCWRRHIKLFGDHKKRVHDQWKEVKVKFYGGKNNQLALDAKGQPLGPAQRPNSNVSPGASPGQALPLSPQKPISLQACLAKEKENVLHRISSYNFPGADTIYPSLDHWGTGQSVRPEYDMLKSSRLEYDMLKQTRPDYEPGFMTQADIDFHFMNFGGMRQPFVPEYRTMRYPFGTELGVPRQCGEELGAQRHFGVEQEWLKQRITAEREVKQSQMTSSSPGCQIIDPSTNNSQYSSMPSPHCALAGFHPAIPTVPIPNPFIPSPQSSINSPSSSLTSPNSSNPSPNSATSNPYCSMSPAGYPSPTQHSSTPAPIFHSSMNTAHKSMTNPHSPTSNPQSSASTSLAPISNQHASTPSPLASISNPHASTPTPLASMPNSHTSTPTTLASMSNPHTSMPTTLASISNLHASTPTLIASESNPHASTTSPLASISNSHASTSTPLAYISKPHTSTPSPITSISIPHGSTTSPLDSISNPHASIPNNEATPMFHPRISVNSPYSPMPVADPSPTLNSPCFITSRSQSSSIYSPYSPLPCSTITNPTSITSRSNLSTPSSYSAMPYPQINHQHQTNFRIEKN